MDRNREAGEQGGVAGGGVGTHQPANPTLPTSSTPSPTTVDPVKASSIEKFMGEDYERWSFCMRLMYTQYKLLDLVEGKEKMPEAAELKGAWMKRSFDAYMLMFLDVHSPTHATGIVLLARWLRDIKFVDREPMQPVLDEIWDIFTKLQGGSVVYLELVQCVEIVIRLPESWSALAINLNSHKPQWSVDYIRARILEEDLRRRSVERSEEGAGYGVGGGKSGFKKKWKGKNKDNPKEDGGGGQGEVCFYCKKRGHCWRKCYQRPKDWTPPSSSNHCGGMRSGGVMGASGEEKDEEKGGKSEERKAGFFFFVNEGTTDLAMVAKLHLEDLPGSELTSDHSGGGEQQVSGPAREEGLEDESARVDSPSQPEPAANAKVTKRSVQRGASPHGQQTVTREKRVAAAPSRLKHSRLGGPKQGAMAVQAGAAAPGARRGVRQGDAAGRGDVVGRGDAAGRATRRA
ncbi:unnamed protein product [Closterium sp. NIES-65]|nr:unnamed protein product [Closterium sp. NIES-65]